ncbi:hypothetical protein [Bradyrhizobium sp. NP1]|uniref:hypothetical protein n=1 Tax=Bradyrhizobium sp. NP1 TaxID=3049772 RepID=UPI0025A4D99A|nr:hypothetical protein [Bradyrhizobium sp. NP1]WJR76497.1 hypothetical protein QOU61_27590 [Bradyrhizobium sp. NP1]
MWIALALVSIVEALIYAAGYAVARLLLPLLSFGKVYVAPLNSGADGINWLGYRRDARQWIEIKAIVAGWIGFIACVAVFVIVALLSRFL